MVTEIFDLTLFLFALTKETFAFMLPANLAKAVKYTWNGMQGGSTWTGYLMASAYYLSAEWNFGDELCLYSSYGYEVIDWLNVAVDFATAFS